MTAERWVEKRLASLQAAPGWKPDAARAMARVRERDRVYLVRRRRWAWISVAAALASLTVLSIPGRCGAPDSNSCGQPLANRLWREVFPKPVVLKSVAEPAPVPAPIASVPPVPAPAVPEPVTIAQNTKAPAAPHRPAQAAPVAATNFKEFGNPSAPIVLEVYTDYQCPACAALYKETIPLVISQLVQTGKARLLHRDYPLQQHQHARLAARYANAAGRLGQYDVVVNQLFQTQDQWEKDGNIDRHVAQVLAPGVMQKVRDLVQNDSTLDDTVNADVAMGKADAINQTPTTVVVYKGKRQPIPGVIVFNLLQTYVDQILAK